MRAAIAAEFAHGPQQFLRAHAVLLEVHARVAVDLQINERRGEPDILVRRFRDLGEGGDLSVAPGHAHRFARGVVEGMKFAGVHAASAAPAARCWRVSLR